jgi:two-component system, response regulator, stage 0 sporulation protein A
MSVLLVDGSESFLASALRWIQSRQDLELVGTARTGPQALDAVDRLKPDLVIVDAVLPGMDGFRIARTLKIRGDAPLVLLATFHASAAARQEAFAAGADGFVAKYDFSDEIEPILEKWRAERRTAPMRRVRELRDVPEG